MARNSDLFIFLEKAFSAWSNIYCHPITDLIKHVDKTLSLISICGDFQLSVGVSKTLTFTREKKRMFYCYLFFPSVYTHHIQFYVLTTSEGGELCLITLTKLIWSTVKGSQYKLKVLHVCATCTFLVEN